MLRHTFVNSHHTRTLSLACCLLLSLARSPSLSLTHTLTHSFSHARSHTQNFTRTHNSPTHARPYLCPSLSFFLTQFPSPAHTHTSSNLIIRACIKEAGSEDDEAAREAKKGRKVALKATRRIARALCVQFKDSEDDDAENEELAGPFDEFPTRKQAKKLSDSQREAMVKTQKRTRTYTHAHIHLRTHIHRSLIAHARQTVNLYML